MLQAIKKAIWGQDSPPQQEFDRPPWSWTPDQTILEGFFHQLMFIPDDMMVGMKHHGVLKDICVKQVNPSCYTQADFLAFKRDLGEFSYPVIMPGDFQSEGFLGHSPPGPAKVRGELHLVVSRKIYLLDKFRQNGVQFVRQRVKVNYPWRYVSYGPSRPLPNISHHGYKQVVAWMYVGVPKYWKPLIGGVLAQPMKLYEHEGKPRPWIGEFYDFKGR